MPDGGVVVLVDALAEAAVKSIHPMAPATAASENKRCTTHPFVPAVQDCACETAAILSSPGQRPQVSNLIATHTIEGEALLANVGGLLGEVGTIVRSCHERDDGLGYPDGLAGEAIPVEARIVACCDAFNAMTADRSYRAALPLDDALDELRATVGRSSIRKSSMPFWISTLRVISSPPAPAAADSH